MIMHMQDGNLGVIGMSACCEGDNFLPGVDTWLSLTPLAGR